jgi:lysyl-tRNA synthetase class 1
MEKFFWADHIADKIIKRNPKKKKYVCASGITPSGIIHIGAFREVITTDLVVKALEAKGKKTRFIYSWDDFDRFRKVPVGIPKTYEKYLGMPLSEIPSPFNKNQSYAEYFEKQFEKSLKKVGVKAEFLYQHKMNNQSKYAELIKIALDKRKEIMKILNKYRKEPLAKDWMPIAIYCEKCKKDFTKIINVNGYEIEYECKCGFKDKIDIRKKPIVSIKWRVDWPLRWKYEEVDFEPGGIDHSVHGGSFTTSQEIAREIFKIEPPIYQFYDWIKLKGGEEFASSTGNALNLDEVEEVYEPEVLRYLFVGTKPKTGFQISFDNDVIKIYEDYDALERKYYEKTANPREKRIYELSVLKLGKTLKEKTSFRHLMTLVQIGKTKNLSKEDKIRVGKVKNWLDNYAEEEMKFQLQEEINVELNQKEKDALLLLRDSLKHKKLKNSEELLNEFYNICKEVDISAKEFFQMTYEVLIKKTRGPRLADLILFVGKEKIIKLLNQIK